ncbi:rhodanese-like domain-containing protein [Nonlabens sp.]|uniref:rhodanese-like domain-containing protein n=1 Tax=Nonlabens sp. TaxID=1888209 RepID=UPI002600B1E3|nr:rhodanese-like domain-containing protein [Nonlabens sp.]
MKDSCSALLLWIIIMLPLASVSQEKDIPSLLRENNKLTVPYISVQMLQMNYQEYTVVDTRKKEEYQVSHLPKAIWVGEKYDGKNFHGISKDTKIVVYCSVGIRSEDYGEDLLEDGFSKVYNLYGSIFSWKDAGYQIVDQNNQPTEKVHVYGKKWAKYLKTGKKVYEHY